jgi:hypothetical protein
MRMPLGYRTGSFMQTQGDPRSVLPYGNILGAMRYTPKHIGKLVRATRGPLSVAQKNSALTSGTGLRFVVDL